MTDVSAPDVAEWWDVAETKAAVLDILRLSGTDVDEERIGWLIPAAGQMINQWLDRPTGVVPPVWAMPALQAAIETVTVSLYRDKDAPATSVDGILASQFRPAGLDPLIEVQAKLRGVRQRWGVS